jgi:formylmethanofuran dehydrogenase subunit B
MTWQTGFPFAVDFSHGFPRYQPEHRGAELFRRGCFSAALIVGAPASVPPALQAQLGAVPVVAVGPRASEAPFAARVAIDTGIAGIHEAGLGYRMDDVPLPLRAVVPGPRSASETIRQLADRLETGR